MIRGCKPAIKLALSLLLGVQSAFVAAQEPSRGERYSMASGVPGTVPYTIGVGLSSLTQLVLLPEASLALSLLKTDSHDHSLQKIDDGTSQFAIVDSVAAYRASSGVGDFEGSGLGDRLMAAASLWLEVDHFIIADDHVRSGTISDLATLNSDDLLVDLGNPGASRDLLARFGIRMNRGAASGPVDWETLRDQFDNGTILGMAITGSVPSRLVQEVLEQHSGRAQLLELSNWQMKQVGGGWHVRSLTTEDYPGLDGRIDTLARSLMLVVDRDVPETVVYQILKVMFDNLPFLTNLDDAAARISLDHALEQVDLPLHPGAARYYREMSVTARSSGDPGAIQ